MNYYNYFKHFILGILIFNGIAELASGYNINYTIIILIDGSRADSLYVYAGENIKSLLNHSIKFDKSISTFPTITPSAHSSIFTGSYPYQQGIPGFRWFNRDSIFLEYNDYNPIPSKITFEVDRDLTTETIFQKADNSGLKSLTLLEFIKSGSDYDAGSSIRAGIKYFLGNYVGGDTTVFERFIEKHIDGLSYVYPLNSIWVPGVDEQSHVTGWNSNGVKTVYDNLDLRFGELKKALERRGIYNNTLIVIVADHGHSLVDPDDTKQYTRDELENILRNASYNVTECNPMNTLNCSNSDYGDPKYFHSNSVVALNGNIAMIYIRRNNSDWKNQPTFSDVKSVANAFYNMVGVRYVLIKYSGSGGYRIYDGDDSPETLDELDSTYPETDASLRVMNLDDNLDSGRAGDVILVAEYPYYFDDELYEGMHGGLGWEDTYTPLIFSWPGFGQCTLETARNIDIAPTIAELMGFSMGSVDGHALFNKNDCPRGTCTDGIKNNDETDVDCGGPCGKCDNNNSCSSPSDCQSGYCNPNKICTIQTCNDNILNNLETGKDCGGPYCSPCNSTVLINATIHNIGKANASYVNVSFYVNENYTESKTLIFVPANGSRVAGIRYPAQQDSSHILCVKIDPGNLILEKSKANNIACKRIVVPFWGNMSNFMPREGDGLEIKAQRTVDLVVNDTSPPALTENSIGRFLNITANDSITSAFMTLNYDEDNIEQLNESSLRMYYWDNGWILVNESGVDIDNNFVWANVSHFSVFTALGTEKADFELSGVRMPTNVVETDIITVSVNVSNTGGEGASTLVQFYDVDSEYNIQLLGNVSIDLEVNERREISAQWNASLGVHYIYVLADPYDEVAESNESNNIAFVQVNVSGLADLVVRNVTFSRERPIEMQSVVINASAGNIGHASASNVSVGFYDNSGLIGISLVDFIDVNESKSAWIRWNSTFGLRNISVVVDPSASIRELDEGNNVLSVIVNVSQSPRRLKLDALDRLMTINSTNKNSQKEIDGAIKAVNDSLYDEKILWMDWLHLSEKHGNKVFDNEKNAIEHLMKVNNSQEVIDILLKADELLARVAIEDKGGDSRAQEELIKANEEIDKGKYMRAVDRFKKAWEIAVKKG